MRVSILPALLLAGCAPAMAGGQSESAAAELADALEGRTAGPARKCVSLSRIDGPQIVGETLLYRDGTRLWRTEAVDGCPSLRGDPIVIVEVHGGQLCRNDLFRTVDRGGSIPGPYCRFGDFTPYSAKRR